jgi:hypothetical protein
VTGPAAGGRGGPWRGTAAAVCDRAPHCTAAGRLPVVANVANGCCGAPEKFRGHRDPRRHRDGGPAPRGRRRRARRAAPPRLTSPDSARRGPRRRGMPSLAVALPSRQGNSRAGLGTASMWRCRAVAAPAAAGTGTGTGTGQHWQRAARLTRSLNSGSLLERPPARPGGVASVLAGSLSRGPPELELEVGLREGNSVASSLQGAATRTPQNRDSGSQIAIPSRAA